MAKPFDDVYRNQAHESVAGSMQLDPGSAEAAMVRGREALAAEDRAEAERWLDRAHRMAPANVNVTFLLASSLLRRDDARAEALLKELIEAQPRFWAAKTAYATLKLRLNDHAHAAGLLGDVLAHSTPPAGPGFEQLAEAVARGAGLPGWIGMNSRGLVTVSAFAPGADFAVDAKMVWARGKGRNGLRMRKQLPAGSAAMSLSATLAGTEFLGSPLDIRAHCAVEGFVQQEDSGDLTGWAWCPSDPEAIVALTVSRDEEHPILVAASGADFATCSDDTLFRPRSFHIRQHELPAGTGIIHVSGPDGRSVFGSPISPNLLAARASLAARRLNQALSVLPNYFDFDLAAELDLWSPLPAYAPVPKRPTASVPRRAGLDVIIPVYQGADDLKACLSSVRRALPQKARIVVVDDASPDPGIRSILESIGGDVIVLRHKRNKGFPGAVNTGLRHSATEAFRDIVLVNSDTLLPRHIFAHLADVAYSADDIGSVTPMTGDGTIVSYRDIGNATASPNQAETDRLDRLVRTANLGITVDIPTAVGFCMFVRHDCLAETGIFREDTFAQGYGEENDWCLRARHLGWRHLADTASYVCHLGGRSFGRTRADLLARNLKTLNRLHPGYDQLIAAFQRDDPLAPMRRNIDVLRWRRCAYGMGSVVLVSHRLGGGVERHVSDRMAAIREKGLRPILLRPVENAALTAGKFHRCGLADSPENEYPNLFFDLPQDFVTFVEFLRRDRPKWVELHHLMGHSPVLANLGQALGLPVDVFVHDYASVCPRITFCGKASTYCGEPLNVSECDACIADTEDRFQSGLGVAELRRRSDRISSSARAVIVPTIDTANRLARYHPDAKYSVKPWEDDAAVAQGDYRWPHRSVNTNVRVCIVGAIGEDKGYYVLLACARDAMRRALPLRFAVVGYTMDDSRLIKTAQVHVTGKYQESEVNELIRAQKADLGLLPSVWPETWSYTLSAIFQSGLWPVAFDLGAQAERIRAVGRGTLLPIGMPASQVNDTLIAVARSGGRS